MDILALSKGVVRYPTGLRYITKPAQKTVSQTRDKGDKKTDTGISILSYN